jgi:hypothetical protein
MLQFQHTAYLTGLYHPPNTCHTTHTHTCPKSLPTIIKRPQQPQQLQSPCHCPPGLDGNACARRPHVRLAPFVSLHSVAFDTLDKRHRHLPSHPQRQDLQRNTERNWEYLRIEPHEPLPLLACATAFDCGLPMCLVLGLPDETWYYFSARRIESLWQRPFPIVT